MSKAFKSPNRMVHVYMPGDEADLIEAEAAKAKMSVTALFRGAIKAVTNDLTDFSEVSEWADFRPRGRPRGTATTGNQVNDASWNLMKHSINNESLSQQMARAQELIDSGMSIDQAVEKVFSAHLGSTSQDPADDDTTEDGSTEDGDEDSDEDGDEAMSFIGDFEVELGPNADYDPDRHNARNRDVTPSV